jgi:hypothetical protein
MNALDYPIDHFSLLFEIAKRMKGMSAQILRHEYHYESFGSWWFTFRRHGELHRLLYDGKEFMLTVETVVERQKSTQNFPNAHGVFWKQISSIPIADQKKPTVEQVVTLLERITT